MNRILCIFPCALFTLCTHIRNFSLHMCEAFLAGTGWMHNKKRHIWREDTVLWTKQRQHLVKYGNMLLLVYIYIFCRFYLTTVSAFAYTPRRWLHFQEHLLSSIQTIVRFNDGVTFINYSIRQYVRCCPRVFAGKQTMHRCGRERRGQSPMKQGIFFCFFRK